MKKLMCLILFLNLFSFSIQAEDSQSVPLEKINTEIHAVQKEIYAEELKAMEAEVNSEKYIKYEWDKYVGEIQKAEESDQKIEELEEQLKKLKDEKAKILKERSLQESKH